MTTELSRKHKWMLLGASLANILAWIVYAMCILNCFLMMILLVDITLFDGGESAGKLWLLNAFSALCTYSAGKWSGELADSLMNIVELETEP